MYVEYSVFKCVDETGPKDAHEPRQHDVIGRHDFELLLQAGVVGLATIEITVIDNDSRQAVLPALVATHRPAGCC